MASEDSAITGVGEESAPPQYLIRAGSPGWGGGEVSTGKAFVGNVGSAGIPDVTVLGDVVNVAVELRSLIEEGDVDEERLAELRAELERLREIAEAEGEEARAAFETVRELMEEAGLEPPRDRSGGGKGEGCGEGRGDRGGRHEDSPGDEDGDRHGNSSLRTRSEDGSAAKGLRRAGGGGLHEFELGGTGLLQQ